MEIHSWKEKTDLGTTLYRACHHAGQWRFESMPKVGRSLREEVSWTPFEPARRHWQTLRDLLHRKYQRKRCPWQWIEEIDKLLEDLPPDPAAEQEPS